MKKLNYTLEGSGVKPLRLFSLLFFIVAIIGAFILFILGINVSDHSYGDTPSVSRWILFGYSTACLFFGGIVYGVSRCIAIMTENSIIRNISLKAELEEKDIIISKEKVE